MSTNLPDNRIKKVKLPNNSEYEIIPSRLQSSGFEATLPVLTEDSVIPVLNSDGKLDSSVLPALAISDTFVVASQAAMLALTAEVGDIAVRTDLNKSFILKTAGASTLSHWQELLTPIDAVTSVNGKTGVVTLNATDVNALPSDYSPEIKTLNTNNTASQTASSSEEIKGTGTINLHKVAKTGSYNDLLNKPSFTDTNQKVKVGNVTFGDNDVVEFVAGNNTTITGNASAKTITIDATNPIVDQDLLAIGFTPVAGTYYRHTGITAQGDPLVLNENPENIYFDTSKSVDEIAALLEQVRQTTTPIIVDDGLEAYVLISDYATPTQHDPGDNIILLYYAIPTVGAVIRQDGATEPVYFLVHASDNLTLLYSSANTNSVFIESTAGWAITPPIEYNEEIEYLSANDILAQFAGKSNSFVNLINSTIYHYINNDYLPVDTPKLAMVAKSGKYTDLSNKPAISILTENIVAKEFIPEHGAYYKASLSSSSETIKLPLTANTEYAVNDKIHVDTSREEEFSNYLTSLFGSVSSSDYKILAGTSLSLETNIKVALIAYAQTQDNVTGYVVYVGSATTTANLIYANTSNGILPQEWEAEGIILGFNNLDSNDDFTIPSSGSQDAPWTITRIRSGDWNSIFRWGEQTIYNNKLYYYDGRYKEIPLKTDFSNVAFSGDYNDLINTPAAGDNYYHTPEYSTGMKIATGHGVNDMYVPTGTTSGTVAIGNHTHAYADLTNRPAVLDSIKDQSSGIGLLKLTNGVASIDNSEYALTSQLPTTLADLSDDATHRVVTDTEKSTWNGKQAGSTVLTNIASQSSGAGLLKLTNGVASLDSTAYTTNTGTVTSVRVQAGTGLSSSTSTAQTSTLDTTISIASGYKLPTTTEWGNKADTSSLNSYLPLSAGSSKALLGSLYTNEILPDSTTKEFNLGSLTNQFNSAYANRLELSSTSDISKTGSPDNAVLVIGPRLGAHLEFDGNEIMAKQYTNNAQTSSTLYIQNEGGLTNFGDSIVVTGHVYPASSSKHLGVAANRWSDLQMTGFLSKGATGSTTCSTAAGTAEKVVTVSNFGTNVSSLSTGNTFNIYISNANTAQSALTLNINSIGAKPIYINNAASSTTNYTLDKGWHVFYYNGTNFYTSSYAVSEYDAGTSVRGGTIVPMMNNSYDLGVSAARWRSLYLSSTLYSTGEIYTTNIFTAYKSALGYGGFRIRNNAYQLGTTTANTSSSAVTSGIGTYQILDKNSEWLGIYETTILQPANTTGIPRVQTWIGARQWSDTSGTTKYDCRLKCIATGSDRWNASLGDFVPDANNTYNLGRSSIYWKAIYGANVYATSDRRLKENIKKAKLDCSEVIDKLQLKEFNFKGDEEKKVVVGAIAQELQEILPEKYRAELVSGSEEEYYSINEGKLLYIAIGALKDEMQKTKDLEERLERVEKLLEK